MYKRFWKVLYCIFTLWLGSINNFILIEASYYRNCSAIKIGFLKPQKPPLNMPLCNHCYLLLPMLPTATYCYLLLPFATYCYLLLPLLPTATAVTYCYHCYLLLPLLPITTYHCNHCYLLLPIATIAISAICNIATTTTAAQYSHKDHTHELYMNFQYL